MLSNTWWEDTAKRLQGEFDIHKVFKYLLVVLTALFWGLLPATESQAYVITGMRLVSSEEMSRLVLQADGPLEFKVDLTDPQTVVLSLPNSSMDTPKPNLQNDPVIKDIQAKITDTGLALVITTRAPGVTVLPFYDAGTRQLTLELGGSPSLSVAVPPKKTKPEPQKKSTPKPAPKPPVKPEPEPAPAKIEKKAVQAPAPRAKTPQPQPVVAAVAGVRLGTNKEYTRLVVDGDAPLQAGFDLKGGIVYLSFKRAELLPEAPVPSGDKRIKSISIINPKPLKLALKLHGPLFKHRIFKQRQGNQIILDLVTKQEQEPKKQPQAKSAAADQQKEIKTTKELPEPESDQFPQQLPEPQAPGADQAGQAPLSASQTNTKVAAPENTSRDIPLVSYAEPVEGNKAMTRGKIPPVPPPQPLARPRGPLEKEATEKTEKQEPAIEQEPPQAPQAKAPQPEENRFPQGALLGPKARQDIEARTLFDRAKEALDSRRFDEAINGFQLFLKTYPDHPLAEEAHFRLADAFLYKNERNIAPSYDEVMLNYQKAVDLYPKSEQVPWAFAMMGEAAILAQEPYKAVGYFDLVTEDHPKSEYVPLAKVKKGAAFLAQAKYRRAIDEYREVSSKYPDSRFRRDADWGQARALFGIARYERASLLLKDMDRRNPELRIKEPELLYYIGEADYQLKRYESARRYFLWALNIMPDIPYADIMLTRVGDTYQFEKDYKTAKDIYRRVVEKWPETDGALVARIRLAESPKSDEKHPVDLFQIEATTDAFETYKEIAEKYPDRQVAQLAQLKLGVYYYKKQQYNKSLNVLSKLVQRHPRTIFRPDVDYTRNLAAMALLAEFKDQNMPLRLMEYYLKNQDLLTRPNSNQVLRLLAWAYDQAGLSKRAAKLYEILMVRGVDEPAINLALARNRMKEREFKAVEGLLTKDDLARLKGDDLILARSLLARALAKQKKCKQADRVFAGLLAKAPNHKNAPLDYQTWADCLAEMKQYKKGLAALEKASALLKTRTDINSGLQRYITVMQSGSLARRAGMLTRAIDEFKKAQDLAPTIRERAQAIYETAMAYKQAGKPEKLAPAFQRLVKFKVKPWSDMAARHLKDMELAPSLAQVGR
ncbi:tetratricopeptide repeat protein [Dethiosulfatarculus sandiegensis]|uniref:Outer membrane lipoprotein BamD-like domain-containing protein n=1 Tax=Dethiosulfatarculus sandiegensis TaxID=1429043 RepID=A0A0D2JCZ2_9BACT|nr:tetratricopeptide repeat protein [Dethiosulfatarculus sandiegensis]KIX16039.1 hypothetical protein X474_00465 [Dethiosulfatarculus sandiegensis]